ncbi:unnamed protein product [Schistocephalus solidus]|uniref:Late expression factor 11 n=1 Tax=Schistocephalus solidus TaxID=70667 RepID=A0A183SHH4_SCHSO|nr:unnamed protein product [Schistocephalus solidus]
MISKFHAILNSVYPDMQFTMEAEANSRSDVLVHHKHDGSLKTTVYMKAIYTHVKASITKVTTKCAQT